MNLQSALAVLAGSILAVAIAWWLVMLRNHLAMQRVERHRRERETGPERDY